MLTLHFGRSLMGKFFASRFIFRSIGVVLLTLRYVKIALRFPQGVCGYSRKLSFVNGQVLSWRKGREGVKGVHGE
jgi:hypothetical protein